jgi:excisionase family DNA binding protein
MLYYRNSKVSSGQMMMVDKLLKGNDVAERLNVSKAFAYRMMADGRIPTVTLGRSVRVRPEDLENFIEASVTQRDGILFPS